MDNTPAAFLEEIRISILRKRVGQIALAVVIAQEIWRFVSALNWYLVIPLVARMFEGSTESVLFKSAALHPVPWENLLGSVMEFLFTVIVVFYLNRWIHRRPPQVRDAEHEPEFSLVGQSLTPPVEDGSSAGAKQRV